MVNQAHDFLLSQALPPDRYQLEKYNRSDYFDENNLSHQNPSTMEGSNLKKFAAKAQGLILPILEKTESFVNMQSLNYLLEFQVCHTENM